MKVGSLFTGIGGFDLGFERAGMEIAWQVEIDEFCNKVLAKHWPNVKRFKDVKTVSGKELEPVDLLCGGVPCQPASCAGKRRGTKDDRWLWKEPFRIIAELDPKPKWCVFENVRGLLTLENGLVFDNLLSELENLGYETRTFCLPACAVNAPHRRDRVWIVAHAGCFGQAQQEQQAAGSKQSDSAGEPVTTGGFKWGEYHQPATDTTNTGIENVRKPEICSIQNADASDSEGRENNQRNGRSLDTPERSGECSDSAVSVGDKYVADTEKQGLEWWIGNIGGEADTRPRQSNSQNWSEPWLEVAARLCRVDDGLPTGLVRPKGWRVNSLKALGNAVVPQIPEILGRAIMGIEHET